MSPSTSFLRILILGAWEPEISPLRPLARRLARRRNGPRLHLDVTGVGVVDAALGTEAALKAAGLDGREGDACLFVGTAGVYAKGQGNRTRRATNGSSPPRLGHPVIARRVHLASVAVARGHGYWPHPLVRAVDVDPALRAALHAAAPSLPAADVATTLAITSQPALAGRLARTLGASRETDGDSAPPLALVENLEAFAVARACARRGVAFGAVLGVSNEVGPSAHAAWKRLAGPASASVAAALTAWIEPRPARARR